ncbi:MAG: bifunctional sugar-1-phosphate nucleotidylyltransferase/acetyltransferase [Halobacteriota archaeon]
MHVDDKTYLLFKTINLPICNGTFEMVERADAPSSMRSNGYIVIFRIDVRRFTVKAIVLAAGEGTRLRPFTLTQPKAMVPVANRPILEYVIDSLARSGVTEISLVVGYKKEKVMNYFEGGKNFGVKITYVEQPQQLGTAHAIKLAEDSIEDKFLVLNGDNLISPEAIEEVLGNASGDVTLLLTVKENVKGYGVVTTEGPRVTQIVEKPGTDISHYINTGIYVFAPAVFNEIPYTKISTRGEYEITDTIQRMIEKHYDVTGVHTTSMWIDASYPWDLLNANAAVLSSVKDVPSQQNGQIEDDAKVRGSVIVGENSIIRSGSYVLGPVVVGRDVEIGPNVTILPSTSIGNGVTIDSFTEVRNSLIMNDVRLGSHSLVANSIIGKNTMIGSHFITEQTKIAMPFLDEELHHVMNLGAIIGENCRFGHGILVEAGKIIGVHCTVESASTIRKNIDNYSNIV